MNPRAVLVELEWVSSCGFVYALGALLGCGWVCLGRDVNVRLSIATRLVVAPDLVPLGCSSLVNVLLLVRLGWLRKYSSGRNLNACP